MNLDVNQIQNQIMDYFKHMPQDEMYAYGAAFVGFVLIIIALML